MINSKHITSRDNPLYKALIKLSQGKRVNLPGFFAQLLPNSTLAMLEGVHLCQEWAKANGQPIYAFFNEQQLNLSPELQQLAAVVDNKLIRTIDAKLLKNVSHIAESQGVLFVARVETAALPANINHNCVWLDRVQDPGNVGSILRTVAAAGIKHVYLSEGCAQAWSTRVLRSAQGAHFSLKIYENVSLLAAVKQLEVPLYAADLHHDAAAIYDLDLSKPCAWVFGNEGQGVSHEIIALATQSVYIPLEHSVESLNVSVAAAICLFEQYRQTLALN